MNQTSIIGIDLGGTHVRAGAVEESYITKINSERIPSSGTQEEVLQVIYQLIDSVIDENAKAIGIGVPSVVDTERGIMMFRIFLHGKKWR